MRVRAIEQSVEEGRRQLRCEVELADGASQPLWYEWTGPGPLATPGDPLLAVLLPGALAIREDLQIDGAVSASVLAAARERVLPALARFHPGYEPVELRAAEAVAESALPPAGGGAAALYSGGLDSSYTLVRNRERLTHLVFAHGLDVGIRWAEVREQVCAKVAKTAHMFDLGLLETATRIRGTLYRTFQERARERSDERVRFLLQWGLGCLLASQGHLLTGTTRRLVIAGSWDDRYHGATASHPDIEPAWSTPRVAIELDGVGVTRMEKALYLAEHEPALLRGLRVCNGRPLRADNCGRCPKCVRLRMELRVAEIPTELHPFDEVLSDAELRRSFITIDEYFWPEILRWAERAGDHEAARTAEILMDRRFHLGRELARLRERWRHPGKLHYLRGRPSGT